MLRTIIRTNLLVGAGAVALAWAGASAAWAQDDAGANGTVETVVVTATKKPESLQNVPISVVAVSGMTLQKRGFIEMTDLQGATPNLEINQTNGNYVITVRGLGSGAGNFAFEQSVGQFVDGVYSGRSRAFQVPFLDVDDIEVVRGPQGALFGVNTDAGAISMTTRKPTDTFEAEARASGEFATGGFNASGFVSGPVSDTLDLRLSAETGQEAGFVHDILTNTDQNSHAYYAARAQALWKPTGDFSALLKVEGFHDRYGGNPVEFNSMGPSTCAGCVAEINASGGANAVRFPGYTDSESALHPEFNSTASGNGTLTLNWTVGGWALTSISSFQALSSAQDINADGGGLHLLFAYQDEDSSQFSQEVRADRIFDNGLEVMAGMTYLNTRLFASQQVVYTGAAATAQGFPFPLNGYTLVPILQHGNMYSPYLVLKDEILPHLFATASGRYSADEKRAHIWERKSGVVAPNDLTYDLYPRLDEGLWDYSANLRYEFDENKSVYVSYATGTKAGGFVSNNATLASDMITKGAKDFYLPEQARSWEIGTKLRLFDGHAVINADIFSTKFSNLQVSSFQGTTFVTTNAAQAHSRGIEVDATYRPDEIFQFGGSAAYLDARYDNYPGGQCPWTALPSCTSVNLKGNQLLRAPMWKGSAYGEAIYPVGNGFNLSGRASVDFESRSFFQPDLNPLNSQPSFAKVDLRAAISPNDDAWEVSLTARNIANVVTFSQAYNTPVINATGKGAGSHNVVIDQGRTITLEGVVRF
jgi:iron complex outermembrane receptor protein